MERHGEVNFSRPEDEALGPLEVQHLGPFHLRALSSFRSLHPYNLEALPAEPTPQGALPNPLSTACQTGVR